MHGNLGPIVWAFIMLLLVIVGGALAVMARWGAVVGRLPIANASRVHLTVDVVFWEMS